MRDHSEELGGIGGCALQTATRTSNDEERPVGSKLCRRERREIAPEMCNLDLGCVEPRSNRFTPINLASLRLLTEPVTHVPGQKRHLSSRLHRE